MTITNLVNPYRFHLELIRGEAPLLSFLLEPRSYRQGDVPLSWRVVVSKVTAWTALQSSSWRNTRSLQTAFTADYVLGISIYIHTIVRSFGLLLDTSAIRGENMKHSEFNKGTSPTTGDARPVYTIVVRTDIDENNKREKNKATGFNQWNNRTGSNWISYWLNIVSLLLYSLKRGTAPWVRAVTKIWEAFFPLTERK